AISLISAGLRPLRAAAWWILPKTRRQFSWMATFMGTTETHRNDGYLAFRDLGGFDARPSPAITVSSSIEAFEPRVFFVSVRLCLRISIKSTTFAGAGPFAAGACGATPATLFWMTWRTLS